MLNDFKGFSYFNDIDDERLRAYNRCMTFFNIIKDHNLSTAKQYVSSMTNQAKVEFNNLLEEIKTNGLAATRNKCATVCE